MHPSIMQIQCKKCDNVVPRMAFKAHNKTFWSKAICPKCRKSLYVDYNGLYLKNFKAL